MLCETGALKGSCACWQLLYDDCFYFRPCTLRELRRVDARVACAHFSEAFQNPAEFTLCFTGSLQARLPACPRAARHCAAGPAWACECSSAWHLRLIRAGLSPLSAGGRV